LPMKRLTYLLFLSIMLVSCGESRGHFKIEGRFLHMNDGQLYVYSPDGVIDGMDTVTVQDGRFALEVPCRGEGTLMIVFPNFSQQPVFAESGGSVEIKADASHLREMEIKGTKANELMTDFRKSVANVSPPDEAKQAALFVGDHPESPVSVFLTGKYFVESSKPDLKQAAKLIAIMQKEQKDNGALSRLKQQVDAMSKAAVGNSLPAFKATDVNGKTVTNADLNAPVAIVSVFATWSYETMEAQRAIADAIDKDGSKVKALSISIDADKKVCLRSMDSNNITWPVVCDGAMIDGKLLKQLGLTTLPCNVILKNGRIVETGLNSSTLRQRLMEMHL